jgi:dTDP-4-amino-4,6-dideoxygalactose transaminase
MAVIFDQDAEAGESLARRIPLNRPAQSDTELEHIHAVLKGRHLSGDGAYTERCSRWLSGHLGGPAIRLVHSCTAALELAALLAELKAGDEVIVPSFTFPSAANAVVLRGAIPVFVDIRPDTLNLDENRVASAITPRTRMIVPTHYAGVCAEMDSIAELARPQDIWIVEDAAHALGARYHGRPAGALANMGCFSFHESKNIVSGEGGAIAMTDPQLIKRCDILREKGTNRRAFFNGEVDKYTWMDLGSSYLPSEVLAALLWSQLELFKTITDERLRQWQRYFDAFGELESKGLLRRPVVPAHCEHNAHIFYLLLPTRDRRDRLFRALADEGIMAPFHYVPLHSSPAGKRYGRADGPLEHTDDASSRLLRLPLFVGLGNNQDRVIDAVSRHVRV